MEQPDICAWLPELLDQFDDEVYVHTIDGVPLYANAILLRRLGLTAEEFRALPPYGWVADLARPHLPERIEQLAVHGHARFESRYTAPNGTVGSYEIRAKVLSLDGAPVVLAVGRDVSGRQHMQDDLRLRAAMLDLVEDGVLVHDADGTILYANQSLAQMHGYRRHRLLQMNVADLSLDQKTETPELADEADAAFTADHLTAGGAVLHVRVVARLFRHQGRDVVLRVMRPAPKRD